MENAQKRVEQRNYMSRKHTLEYDDVMNKQREVVYGYRNETIDTDDTRRLIDEVIDEAIPAKVDEYLKADSDDRPELRRAAALGQHDFPGGFDGGESGLRGARAWRKTASS